MAWPTSKPASGIPAAGNKGDRPPSGIPAGGGRLGDLLAPPGHVKSVQHGARSERLWRPVADSLYDELIKVRPDLADPQFAPAVRGWARSEAQLLIVSDHAERVGLLDEDGEPRPFTRLMSQLESSATRHRERLGLDPVSFVTLAKGRAEIRALEVNTDTAMGALLDRGRLALERRRAELGIVPPGDDRDGAA